MDFLVFNAIKQLTLDLATTSSWATNWAESKAINQAFIDTVRALALVRANHRWSLGQSSKGARCWALFPQGIASETGKSGI